MRVSPGAVHGDEMVFVPAQQQIKRALPRQRVPDDIQPVLALQSLGDAHALRLPGPGDAVLQDDVEDLEGRRTALVVRGEPGTLKPPVVQKEGRPIEGGSPSVHKALFISVGLRQVNAVLPDLERVVPRVPGVQLCANRVQGLAIGQHPLRPVAVFRRQQQIPLGAGSKRQRGKKQR